MAQQAYASPQEAEFYRRNERRTRIVLAVILAIIVCWRPLSRFAATLVPVSWEIALGQKLDFLVTEPVADPVLDAGLEEIKARLLAAAPGQPYPIRIAVVDSPEVNAYAVPGGRIVVFTGLIRSARSADELSGVLAHEVQHVLNRHSLQELFYRNGFSIAAAALLGRASGLATEAARLKFSRGEESEADAKGFRMLADAGLPTAGMISFFKPDADRDRGGVGLELMSTHPMDATRAKDLEALQASVHAGPVRPLALDWARFQQAARVHSKR